MASSSADQPEIRNAKGMKERINAFNWSATSVGPMERWPQSLKATIKTMLGSRYPMILLWDEALIQIYNDAYTGLIGDKHPGALGCSIRETQAESWDAIGPMIHAVMSTGISNWVPAQMLAVNRSGYPEETYFSLSYSAVENDLGVIQGMLCVCSEVTQQVLGERRLRLQRDLASKAGETRSLDKVCGDLGKTIAEYPWDAPFALVYLQEPDGTLKLRSAVGVNPETPGILQSNSIKKGDPDPWCLKNAMLGKITEINHVDKIIAVRGGPWNEAVSKAIALPIPSSLNTPLGVFVAGISPNHQLDENYHSFYELLAGQVSIAIRNAQAYEEERKRADALTEIDRAKTAFFNNVSHEFRTPLTLMLGPLEEMMSKSHKSFSTGDAEQLTTVYQNSLRLLKLVNTLLDFSRIEAKRVQANYSPIDLSFFTSELASAFESAIRMAGLQYEISCSELSEAIYVDVEMWEKIVFNLLSNALKFTFEGKISVSLAESGTHAILSVEDTGVGIPHDELPNLFKRFHRIDKSRSRSHEGTGIGLALVKELVELHGGNIKVDSEEGKGTIFLVSLPKGSAHLDKERISFSNPESKPGRRQPYINEAALWSKHDDESDSVIEEEIQSESTLLNKKITLLLVDDNADMRKYLKRILSVYWNVETAIDGQEAFGVAKQKLPDLILSDVMMPNMDGFELLAAIRTDATLEQTPVILLSARAGEEATVEGLEQGANDYLVKPFSARELIARVKTQLDIQRARRDNNRLTIDIHNQKLFSKELERKVQERTFELNKTNQELQQFAYVASHDLQEPLRKIISFSELLQNELPQDNGAAPVYLQKISKAATRMATMIKDLLAFSKLAQKDVQYETVDLNVIFENVENDFELLIIQKEASVTCTQLPVVKAVPLQMNQLFYNVLSNALKFTTPTRRPIITIRETELAEEMIRRFPALKDRKKYVCIECRDNGIGFNEKYSDQIFAVFQRLNNKEHYSGSGIGLALCKKIVSNHGGEIFATSKEGDGSTFYMILPKNKPDELL